MTETAPSLYERLGGYDAVSAVASNLLPRLMSDKQLGRFWSQRGDEISFFHGDNFVSVRLRGLLVCQQ